MKRLLYVAGPVGLALLVVARDVLIVTVALSMYLAYGENRFPPLALGKWPTATEMVTGGLFLLSNIWSPVPRWLLHAATIVTGLMLVASGVAYLHRSSQTQRVRHPS